MWNWLGRHSDRLQGLGAIVTAVAALIAILVIPLQIWSSDRIQRDQTAREIYREFLNLTVQKPELAGADYCAISDGKTRIAYEAYVEYLLYTSEQMTESSPEWQGAMADYLSDHLAFFCSRDGWQDQSEGVYQIVQKLRMQCDRIQTCQVEHGS